MNCFPRKLRHFCWGVGKTMAVQASPSPPQKGNLPQMALKAFLESLLNTLIFYGFHETLNKRVLSVKMQKLL